MLKKLSIMCSVTQNEREINMKRKIFLRGIIIAFLSAVLVVGVCEQVQGEISSGVLRLHIIANSDSEYDQRIKLMVRDEIIKNQKNIFPEITKGELTAVQKEKIITIAESVTEGAGYGATVERGRFYFPTKKYENITLPAGEYDALRIVLGEGKGQNWWCVMYPPLCFVDSAVGKMSDENADVLKEKMSDAAYELITDESIKVVPALKIVELWGEIKEKMRDFL